MDVGKGSPEELSGGKTMLLEELEYGLEELDNGGIMLDELMGGTMLLEDVCVVGIVTVLPLQVRYITLFIWLTVQGSPSSPFSPFSPGSP